jgi:hypothetical protein
LNDGFTALWLGTIGCILYATGWHERGAVPPPHRYLLLFLTAAFLLNALVVPLGPAIRVNGSAALLVAAVFIAAMTLRNGGQAAYLVFCSALAAVMWCSVRYLYKTDPVFIIFHPQWDAPLFAGLIAGLLTDRARMQYVTVTLAASAAPLSDLLLPNGLRGTVVIGNLAWWDGFAVAAITARLIGTARTGVRQSAVNIARLRLRQRGGSS